MFSALRGENVWGVKRFPREARICFRRLSVVCAKREKKLGVFCVSATYGGIHFGGVLLTIEPKSQRQVWQGWRNGGWWEGSRYRVLPPWRRG